MSRIGLVTFVVHDYDEAIAFFTGKLSFLLQEDTRLSESKRWVVVVPKGGGCGLLLAKAANETQKAQVGNQAGGRVGFFLYTDDFDSDYDALCSKGVTIVRPPLSEPYGTVAVFADLYGNHWDLIQSSR